ncbi:hypothetical protein B0H66DRAFT_608389 [Apodospora peruviana]|uniref:FAD-binding domain-containing protein n=1 Tax=Apodospora peruviana TaxID=516989 RepID=A0AAE0HSL1_9PEZI|nr:hypothetical protein B0H66DRAFT_608389 [Apodospora peruviana]
MPHSTLTTPHTPEIAIISAGICGLLLAQGLQKNGFKVTVYEKEPSLETKFREWTMLIHWALPVLKNMLPDELLDQIHLAYPDLSYPFGTKKKESIPCSNGVTGGVVFEVSMAARRVSRAKFRRLLTKGLDIQWGKAILDLDCPDIGPVAVPFADGDTTKDDLVIGTDGMNSQVKKWLVGKEAARPLSSEHAIGNGIVRYETAEQAKAVQGGNPLGSIKVHPDSFIFSALQNVPDPQDPSNWFFHVVRIWKEPDIKSYEGDEAIAKVKSITTDNQLRHWVTVPWDSRSGRVTLAGDAAHVMHPNRSQGRNQALNDVGILINELLRVKNGDISTQKAIQAYEKDLSVRGQKAVLESLEDTKHLTNLDDLEKSRHAAKGFRK